MVFEFINGEQVQGTILVKTKNVYLIVKDDGRLAFIKKKNLKNDNDDATNEEQQSQLDFDSSEG